MMQIHHLLLHTILPSVDPCPLLSFLPPKSMKTKQVSVPGLNDVLLSMVSIQRAQVSEIVSFGDRCRTPLGSGLVVLFRGIEIEEIFGAVVAELNEGIG